MEIMEWKHSRKMYSPNFVIRMWFDGWAHQSSPWVCTAARRPNREKNGMTVDLMRLINHTNPTNASNALPLVRSANVVDGSCANSHIVVIVEWIVGDDDDDDPAAFGVLELIVKNSSYVVSGGSKSMTAVGYLLDKLNHPAGLSLLLALSFVHEGGNESLQFEQSR